MTKIRTTIAAVALVALTVIGVSAGTSGTANASVCGDFGRILLYYIDIGDQATASALFDNMKAMGC